MTITELAKEVKKRYDQIEKGMNVHLYVDIEGYADRQVSGKFDWWGPTYFLHTPLAKTKKGEKFRQILIQRVGWKSPEAMLKFLDETIQKLKEPPKKKDPLSPDIEVS